VSAHIHAMSDTLPTLWRPGFLRRADAMRSDDPKWKWAKEKPIDAVVAAVRRADAGKTAGERIVLIKAMTASGKSTLIPPRIWREFAMQRPGGPGVVCTQPRRLTAIRLAQDVGRFATNGVLLGQTLGWLTGVSAHIPPQKTSLLFATIGSVFSALEGAEHFREFAMRWRYIIIDEAHERSVSVDLLLAELRRRLVEFASEQWCPVLIIMSATIDVDQYAKWLDVPENGIVVVEGRSHGIEQHWPAADSEDYLKAAVAAALRAHEELPPTEGKTPGDMLIFLPGAREHKTVGEELRRAATELATAKKPTFLALSIMGATVAEEGGDYKSVFAAMPTLPRLEGELPVRRIIMTTSVAETGLTIDTLAAVIDAGWSRQIMYLPNEHARGLLTAPASRRAVEQRMGRAGRVAPGEFFPLYTRATYDKLREAPLPEVFTAPPAGTMARLLRLRSPLDMSTLDFLEPLPAELVQAGLDVLFCVGFAEPLQAADTAPSTKPDTAPGTKPDTKPDTAPSTKPGTAPSTAARPTPWVLTAVGRHMAAAISTDAMGLSAETAAAVIGAHLWGCAPRDVLIAAAMNAAGVHPYQMPPRLWREVLPSALGKSDGDAGAMAAVMRTAMADENAEAVLLWEHFAHVLEGYEQGQDRMADRREAAAPPARLAEEWAQTVGFGAEGLFSAAGLYSQYADAILRAGLPIETGAPTLRELAKKGPRPFVAGLVRFKRALEHGYRLNIAERDGGEYRTKRGFKSPSPRFPPLKRAPMYLMYMSAEIVVKPDGSHGIALNGVSVLDGFTRGAPGAPDDAPDAEGPEELAPHEVRAHWALLAAARAIQGDAPVAPWNHYKGLAPFDPAAAGWLARESDAAVGGAAPHNHAVVWEDLVD